MKRFAAFILAAALVLSMAGCSENNSGSEPGGDLSIASQTDPGSSGGKLTPSANEAQDIVKSDYSDFKFYAKAQDYDNITKTHKYYEGEITADDARQQIFEKLCSIIKGGEITLKGEQSVQGGANKIITLKNEQGEEFGIAEGLLIEHPGEEGGASILIFNGPHSTLYFGPQYDDQAALKGLVAQGVMTDANLVKVETDPNAKVIADKELQALTQTKCSELSFCSSASEYDRSTREHIEYKGEIINVNIKEQLFNIICGIIQSNEFKLRSGQRVCQSGREITITHENGKLSFVCYEGLLTNNAEEAGGESVFVIASPNASHYFSADSDTFKMLSDLAEGGVISDKNIVKRVKDTSAEHALKNFIASKYSDYKYIGAEQTVNDDKNHVRKYYQGEINADSFRKEIFGQLARIFSQSSIRTEKIYSIQGRTKPILTVNKGNTELFNISEGIYVPRQAAQNKTTIQGGPAVFVVKLQQDTVLYNADPAVRNKLVQLLKTGVMTAENLYKQEEIPEMTKSDVKPKMPVTYIMLRTNFAWDQHISGRCIDANGRYYNFDFSKSITYGSDDLIGSVFENLKNGIAKITDSGVNCDTALLKQGVEYAAKMDPNAKFTSEHKMCDYGQNTLYAYVNGKLVKLYSKGDNDEFTDDENAKKAIECYEAALRKADKEYSVPVDD